MNVTVISLNIVNSQYLISPCSYISSIKHEEDYEEFMENILDRNNSAHVRSYEGIRDIIFKKKKTTNNQKKAPHSNNSSQIQQVNNAPKSSQNNPSVVHIKKGKTKFKDINTYQVKKKQKEGMLFFICTHPWLLKFFIVIKVVNLMQDVQLVIVWDKNMNL